MIDNGGGYYDNGHPIQHVHHRDYSDNRYITDPIGRSIIIIMMIGALLLAGKLKIISSGFIYILWQMSLLLKSFEFLILPQSFEHWMCLL